VFFPTTDFVEETDRKDKITCKYKDKR
jgi:hypothetical protein